MSAQSIENFLQVTADGEHFDFWSAPFNDIQLYVPEQARVVVDATWTANLPGLAAEYLGSRYYWWILLMYNGISDPLNDVVPGKVIRIPSAQQLGVYLQNKIAEKNAGNYLPTLNVTLV